MKRLQEKGWSEKEINHAQRVLKKVTPHDVFFSKVVFWSALVVIVFANLLVSLVLIPFLVVLNSYVLYGLLFVLGLVIGFLYNFLITDIGLLEKKHHRVASVIVPLLALGNFIVMAIVANKFIVDLGVRNSQHTTWLVALVFVVGFILPYLGDQLRLVVKGEE